MASASPKPKAAPPEPAMAERIAGFDWAASPLGPRQSWPAALRFAVDLCLRSPVASAVYWGPELRLVYNDAWRDVLAGRHPSALGQPARTVWADVWDVAGPAFEEAFATGRGTSIYEQAIPLLRDGAVEESYWNYSLTPIVGEGGGVAGLLLQGLDITRALLAERRLSFQIMLADRLRRIDDPEKIKHAATQLLGEYLGASRVGYAEIDEAEGTVLVRSDWTRGAETQSLGGQTGVIRSFGEEALAILRSGEVMAIPDLMALPVGPHDRRAQWEEMGVRALITVPLVRHGALKALLYVHEPRPRKWRRFEAAMARDVAERTWAAVERAQAEQSLRESEDHYRHAVELNPQVSWTALPDGRLNRVAPRWREWTGSDGTGDGWIEGIHEDDRERTLAAWAHSVATGEPYDIEHRLKRVDGRVRWARSRAFPRRAADGGIALWYGSTEDVDERKAAEERQRLLVNELNHRVKNTLFSVQAIAFQTLKGEVTLADARSRFEARLMALSRAHNLLTEQNWEGASLERIVADATEHLAGEEGRFEVEGEPVWMAPRAALALALALHELGTNAVKYGALSSEAGRVSVRWSTGEGRLRVEWKETGGPPVSEPARRGFGSRLLERGLDADLVGTAEMRFESDGLRCLLEATLDSVRTPERSFG
jgi:PAS domain S-box-containing protein